MGVGSTYLSRERHRWSFPIWQPFNSIQWTSFNTFNNSTNLSASHSLMTLGKGFFFPCFLSTHTMNSSLCQYKQTHSIQFTYADRLGLNSCSTQATQKMKTSSSTTTFLFHVQTLSYFQNVKITNFGAYKKKTVCKLKIWIKPVNRNFNRHTIDNITIVAWRHPVNITLLMSLWRLYVIRGYHKYVRFWYASLEGFFLMP